MSKKTIQVEADIREALEKLELALTDIQRKRIEDTKESVTQALKALICANNTLKDI